MTVPGTDTAPPPSPGAPVPLGDFLTTERVAVDVEVSGRKRLFERLGQLLAAPGEGADADAIAHTLTMREKLGCTGIGGGIALPHGRMQGLHAPRMAAVRLRHAIPYESVDGVSVWLAVCLLVPSEAQETHLQLLAALAARFTSPGFAENLQRCHTAAELGERLREAPPG